MLEYDHGEWNNNRILRVNSIVQLFIKHKIPLRYNMSIDTENFKNKFLKEFVYDKYDSYIRLTSQRVSNMCVVSATIQNDDINFPLILNEHFSQYPCSETRISENINVVDWDRWVIKEDVDLFFDSPITESESGLCCKICLKNKICIVLAKCGHVFCLSCTLKFENKCANCRTPFNDSDKIKMYI